MSIISEVRFDYRQQESLRLLRSTSNTVNGVLWNKISANSKNIQVALQEINENGALVKKDMSYAAELSGKVQILTEEIRKNNEKLNTYNNELKQCIKLRRKN